MLSKFRRAALVVALFSGCYTAEIVGTISEYRASPRGGYSFEVPIEILMAQANATVAGGGPVIGTDFSIPMSMFDGDLELSFEIIGTMTTSALEFRVINAAGAVLASISPPITTVPTRFRTSMSAPEAGTFRLSVVGNGDYLLNTARVIVGQKHATRTATFYPLLSAIGTVNAGSAVVTHSANTAYGSFPFTPVWRYRPLNYGGLDSQAPMVFEALFKSASGTESVTAGLQGAFGASVPVELTADSNLALRSVAIADHTVLTSETVGFGVNYKASSNGINAQVYRAGLWVQYSHFSKGEFYVRVHTSVSGGATTYFAGNRYLYSSSAWSGSPVFHIENTGFSMASNEYYLRYDQLDSGDHSGTSVGTRLTNAFANVNSATWMSRRSAEFSGIQDQSRIFVELVSDGAHNTRGTFLIVRYK